MIGEKDELFLSDFKYCSVFKRIDQFNNNQKKINNKNIITKYSSI